MKKILTFIFSAALLFTGCGYDDDGLWKKVDELDDRLTNVEKALSRMNSEIETLAALLDAEFITDVVRMSGQNGWIITLASGRELEINDGRDGQAGSHAPIVTVLLDEEEGVYYWAMTVDGDTDYMYADREAGIRYPVTGEKGENGQNGKDAVSPVIGIDDEGYWTVDHGDGRGAVRMQYDGRDVLATDAGYTYLFVDVELSADGRYYIFHLADGSTIEIMKRTSGSITIVDALPTEYFQFGQARMFELAVDNATITGSQGPFDWSVTASGSRLRIIAPGPDGWETEGTVTISALGTDGVMVSASIYVRADSYELRYLTFEDADYKGPGGEAYWSSLIDSPQYGGPLLYGNYWSVDYGWYDEGNTFLAHEFSDLNKNGKVYWSGGHALSNYVETNVSNGTSTKQLAVYYKDEATGYGGRGGSRNFCVHYGYIDYLNGGMSMSTVLPSIYFGDGEARVVDHMYVTITTYLLNCVQNGNGLTAPVEPEGFVRLVAIGFDENGREIADVSPKFEIANYNRTVTDWQKWDLSELGRVTKIEFNVEGDSDNGYGFSQPAYFAYDDVAVRFE